ncbi:MAG: 50S ribosomal protein L31 type B [Chlamydiae bacterium]|nr:50S ribosomal protein L31 type B [Chlamydiota bacterium]
MKKEIHPKYQKILFIDTPTGHKFVCGAAIESDETEEFEGQTYPVFRVPISSYSHPLFSGKGGPVDAEGRIEKFRKRYAAKQQAPAEKKKEKKKPKK